MINTAKSQPGKNYFSYLVMFAVFAILLYWLSSGIWAIADAITEPVFVGILSYGFLLVIGFIILLGMPQVFKHLYSATDLNLLFTMPIPARYIFWVKYLQSFVGIPLLVFVLYIVPIYVYGAFISANWLYYPIVMLVLCSTIVIGLSIAYLFNLVLVQIIPASKANEFMTVMSMLSGIVAYFIFMLPTMANDRPLPEMILAGLPLFPEWLPITWASDAIIGAAAGSVDFLVPFIMILALAAIFFILTSTLVERGFRTGWVKLSEGRGEKRKKTTAKKSGPKLHHPVIAIGKKEWYAIKRDMREWLVFLPIVFFLVFGFIGAMSGGASLSDLQGPNEVTWPIAQAIFLFIFSMFNGQISSSTIAREAKSLWILRVLPLSGKDIAIGKLWVSWLLPFGLLTLIEIIIGIFLGWTPLQFISGIAMKAVITVGISGIGMWLGTIGAKYNPANPQNRLKFGTAMILLIASYVYLLIALIPYVMLLLPVEAMDLAQDASQNIGGFFGIVAGFVYTILSWKAASPALVVIAGIVLMLIISLGTAYLFTMMSARKIDEGIDIEMVQDAQTKPSLGKKKGSLY
ncbi:putative ABC transporter permease subunit [Lentibacillus juripiscarius]|uniref:ABC-2 type transport system permease protein n=1 Tax=Lentibacillus juripiscarius TaxID=257446 RepID=A0ABW5V771_9BACI